MTEEYDKLISLIKGKKVMLATHWDADGITTGTIIYHTIKPFAKEIKTTSKGMVFRIQKEDIKGDPDVIIVSDIQPSTDLPLEKVIYIDHHPFFEGTKFDFTKLLYYIYDTTYQSCSLLAQQKLIPNTKNPYMIFMTLLGFFGDGGKVDNIPLDLQIQASEHLKIQTSRGIHDLTEIKPSQWKGGSMMEIEKFVSMLNTGKRMHWSGDVPFELFKNITDIKQFIYLMHPIAQQLNEYKRELSRLYSTKLTLKENKNIQYAIINSSQNIQGVLCAKALKDKPVLIINKKDDTYIGSLRVPDHLDFDAGKYLNEFTEKVNTFVGGGHEKAGGFTLHEEHIETFIEHLERS